MCFLQDALTELEELRRIVPKEALVYFLMGKVNNSCCFHRYFCQDVSTKNREVIEQSTANKISIGFSFPSVVTVDNL